MDTIRVPSKFDSTAFSGDGRNSAPNTHGQPEARMRIMDAIKPGPDLSVTAGEATTNSTVSKVAALIVEAELYRPLGTTSPEYRGARRAMLIPYVELSPREHATADTEAHSRLIEELKRQRGEK